MPNNIEKKHTYLLRPKNFKNVIPGDFVKMGEKEEFVTNLLGAMPFETFLKRFKDLEVEKYVLIVGKRRDFIEYGLKNNIAGIVIAGITARMSLILIQMVIKVLYIFPIWILQRL